MPETDLSLLLNAAKSAGDIALNYFGQDPQTWDKDAGQGPVTEADLAVDRMLRTDLLAARPDYGWLSEETPDAPDRLTRERVFIVDPIDGTRSFIAGEKGWGHALAVATGQEVTAAVIALPALGAIYSAAKGQGAFLNGTRISVSGRGALPDARVMINSKDRKPEAWAQPLPDLHYAFRQALAYRMALVAQGEYDAMVTFRPVWEWDGAAGALLITEAGGRVATGTGGTAQFNSPSGQVPGMIAGTSDVVGALIDRLPA